MGEKEFKAFEKALKKQREEILRSKESAIKALINTGIIDADGNYKTPYESLINSFK